MAAEPPEPMQLVQTPTSLQVLRRLSEDQFGELVKAVVDIGRRIMVIGGELHADGEGFLLDLGSRQQDLWGITLYPAQYNSDDVIEFPATRQEIIEIVNLLVQDNER